MRPTDALAGYSICSTVLVDPFSFQKSAAQGQADAIHCVLVAIRPSEVEVQSGRVEG